MKSKNLAGISLAVMAGGFLLTLFLPKNDIVFLLKGGFEAGLVGGIADWFAVTALFRHPFGIPIPHTSLLLKNRDKIVQSLISSMETELLNKQSIENKLRKLNILKIAASLLTKMMSKRQVRRSIVDLLIQLAHRLPLDKAVPMIQSGMTNYIRDVDLKAAADAAITKVINDKYDQKAFDYVLNEASNWAVRPDTKIMLGKLASEKLGEIKLGGFMGFAFQAFAGFADEEKLGDILQKMLVSGLRDLRDQDNTYRETIIREVRVQLFQLANNDASLTRLKDWAVGQLNEDRAQAFIAARLEDIRGMIISKLEAEREQGGRMVFAAYRSILRNLNQEPEMIAVWEARVLSSLIQFAEANHYRIGQLVQENLNQMDDETLVKMLEEKVGKDLQWIRVNGALCGFVVGIVLALLQMI